MTIHRGDKKTPDMFSLPAAEQPLATEQEKPKTKKGVEALSPYLGTKKNRFNYGSSSKYDVELTAVVNLSVEEIKKLWRGEEPEIEPLPEYIPSTQD